MALYCVTCRRMANDGSAVCSNCNNGFVSKLACATCQRVVQSGVAYCTFCANAGMMGSGPVTGSVIDLEPPEPGELVRSPYHAMRPRFSNLPVPVAPMVVPVRVPERYAAGTFGVKAEVQMEGRDAEILTDMNHMAAALLAMAAKMNEFQGIGDTTRAVIRGCRNLANMLQEEVETRCGPSGPTR